MSLGHRVQLYSGTEYGATRGPGTGPAFLFVLAISDFFRNLAR